MVNQIFMPHYRYGAQVMTRGKKEQCASRGDWVMQRPSSKIFSSEFNDHRDEGGVMVKLVIIKLRFN